MAWTFSVSKRRILALEQTLSWPLLPFLRRISSLLGVDVVINQALSYHNGSICVLWKSWVNMINNNTYSPLQGLVSAACGWQYCFHFIPPYIPLLRGFSHLSTLALRFVARFKLLWFVYYSSLLQIYFKVDSNESLDAICLTSNTWEEI